MIGGTSDAPEGSAIRKSYPTRGSSIHCLANNLTSLEHININIFTFPRIQGCLRLVFSPALSSCNLSYLHPIHTLPSLFRFGIL